jgi:hypothetical protein
MYHIPYVTYRNVSSSSILVSIVLIIIGLWLIPIIIVVAILLVVGIVVLVGIVVVVVEIPPIIIVIIVSRLVATSWQYSLYKCRHGFLRSSRWWKIPGSSISATYTTPGRYGHSGSCQ